MHLVYCLLVGWEIVNAVGQAQRFLGLFGWVSGLPLAAPLLEWDAIVPAAVADMDDDGLVFVRYQYVFFEVYRDFVLGEDRSCVVVGRFANAHCGIWEVGERICTRGFWEKLGKWEARNIGAYTHATIVYSHPFCWWP